MTQTHDFDPFLRYFWSYFGLAPGRIQSGVKNDSWQQDSNFRH